MLKLQSRITFTPKASSATMLNWIEDPLRPVIVFEDIVNSVEITSSFKNMSDTAKIIVPRKLTWKYKPLVNGLQSLIQRGDKVKIELGYYTQGTIGLREVFNGYVTKLVPNAPVIIHCEDSMFVVKDILVTYPSKRHLKTVSPKGKPIKFPHTVVADSTYNLNELLSYMLDGFSDQIQWINLAGPVEMGTLLWTNLSAAQVLEQLRSGNDLGACLYSYFVPGDVALKIVKDYSTSTNIANYTVPTLSEISTGIVTSKFITTGNQIIDGTQPVLCIGFMNNPFVSNTETFGFESNIIQDTGLFYQIEKDINLTVIGKSRQRKQNNREIQVKVGALDGNVKTFYAPCDTNEIDLKNKAQAYYNNFAYTGYRGSFTTFGEPFVQPGDRAQLYSLMFPEKNGKYQIISVNREFGMSGYRQEIELGVQVGGTDFIPPKINPLLK